MKRYYFSANKVIRGALAVAGTVFCSMALSSSPAFAECPNVTQSDLTTALQNAVAAGNGGLGLNMWATIVDRDGSVCLVARSGATFGAQWPGSRVISAQKANTANAFSLDGLALSTANLFSATQPGGSLFGLQASNPVDDNVAYAGTASDWGTGNDALIGKRIGGVNVFGGGLALYSGGVIVGALGVSGDTSCADHNIAWRVREALGLGTVPFGVSPNGDDGIIYDITGSHGNLQSKGGFGHPRCGGTERDVAISIGAGG